MALKERLILSYKVEHLNMLKLGGLHAWGHPYTFFENYLEEILSAVQIVRLIT